MDAVKKKIALKILDSGMVKLSQPSTQTGIATMLGCITFFSVHNTYIQVGTVVLNFVIGVYNWIRNEITQVELEAAKAVANVTAKLD